MRQYRRRQLLIATCALLAAPIARSQPARRFRVGFLWGSNEAIARPLYGAFEAGMRDRGYLVDRNLTLDTRYAQGDLGRMPALAEELIALKPDVLVGTEGSAIAFRSKTATIPIVLAASVNPVAAGLVQSLARPGTNVTGLSFRLEELIAKQVELLVEIDPRMSRLGLFNFAVRPGDPGQSSAALIEQSVRKAASAKGLTLAIVAANDVAGARNAFEQLKNERVQGLVVAASGNTLYLQEEIVAGAKRLRLPAISTLPAAFAEAGGLATYGPNFLQNYRYAAKYVDLILKGAKPADMPIEQMTSFEFVINLKTAKEIGLTIPQTVLLRADRVIE